MKKVILGISVFIVLGVLIFFVDIIARSMFAEADGSVNEVKEIQTEISVVGGDIEIQNELSLLPEIIQNEYASKGEIKVVLDMPDTPTVCGLYYPVSDDIYIKADSIEYATLHEIGHFVDYALGSISEAEYFINIYEQEKTLVSEYCQQNSKEFFAEAFKMYFHGELGESLLIHQYFDDLMIDIEKGMF